MVVWAALIAPRSSWHTGRLHVDSGRPCWLVVNLTLYVKCSGKSPAAQVPELAPRFGVAHDPNAAIEQSDRDFDVPLPQLNGPTRVPVSSTPLESASQTSSVVVMLVPR